ncbi:MAG: hypothetical protein JJV98_01085 [Desulfosarcina sp.]|nr:hypothetical protein [Desulfobacterales bacterium]
MPSDLSLLSELGLSFRFMRDFPAFLKKPLTPAECERRVRTKLASREASFIDIIERVIFRLPHSPYHQLMRWAAIESHQVKKWVDQRGVEGTLEALYDAGVYLSLDEFKSRTPIVRQGFELRTQPRDFDNPLATAHFVSQTGGSRSSGKRIYLDLDHYTQDAVYDYFFLQAHDLMDRPHALWRPTPPWGAGIKALLSRAKIGMIVHKWFSQNDWTPTRRNWKHSLMTAFAVYSGRLMGHALAAPEHVHLNDAWRVARWLANQKSQGRAAWLNTNAASGVRVCMAALDRNIDISDTLFRFGGEPLTPAKAGVVSDAGARAVCHYTMGEIGRIGIACAAPKMVDEVHILSDKIAVIQREKTLSEGQKVRANIYTTLLPACPKFMLNVESDDYGILERRHCGCLMGKLGYDLHFHTIRSYEKLTSEGMNFLGSDLIRLGEEILPKRFGGYPTDYQFLETEENGLPKVNLVVSPRVGKVDEHVVVATVIDSLNAFPGSSDDYAERWREGGTLRVLRQEPCSTGASKVLALHVQKPS